MSVGESTVIPEPRSAPARSRAATRQRLVEAGTTLFAEVGLHGVTSARIARAAGVATGTFYLHFKDKETLFAEIVNGVLEELFARQERAAAAAAGGPGGELRARTEELLAFAVENRDLIRVVFGRGGEAFEEQVLDAVRPAIQQRLEQLAAEGRIPATLHPAVAAQARAATLTRVIAWWVEDPTRATRDEMVDTLIQLDPGAIRSAASEA